MLVSLRYNRPVIGEIHKFGFGGSLLTSETPATVWPLNSLNPWPAAAAAATIESDSDEDAVGGTGVSKVLLRVLDGLLVETEHEITLTGTSPVSLPVDPYRMGEIICLDVGSSGANVGNISVKQGGNTIAYVSAGDGETLHAFYTVPSRTKDGIDVQFGYLAEIAAIMQRPQANTAAEISIRARRGSGYSWNTKGVFPLVAGGSSFVFESFTVNREYPPGTDFEAIASYVSTNGVSVAFEFEIVLF